MPKKISKQIFIERAKKVHGDKYDYSKVNYINANTPVCIICPKHGEFWQRPSNHLLGRQCPLCSHRSYKYTNEEFIEKAKKIHGEKYDYSKVEYINNKTPICIICPKHGEFKIRPDNFFHGHGCYKCGKESMAAKQQCNTKIFIERAKKVHGDSYDYSKVNYINWITKVCIICPKHGEFWQTPDNHIQGHGCPYCDESKLEKEIADFLNENNIKYEREKTFEWLKYKSNLFIDFYLPKYKIAIECQGEQHYKPVEYFGGKKTFEKNVARDIQKRNLCELHNIKMIYFSSKKHLNEITNINELLNIIKK